MSSGFTPDEQSTRPEGKDELWLICPICKKPNPSGTLHCKFCWGPSLYAVKPVSSVELEEILKHQQTRQKRSNFARTLIVTIAAPALLLGAVFFYLYNFTDVVFSPPTQMNSSSLPGEWSMFQHDLGRTGVTEISPVSPQGKLKWTFKTVGMIHSSPVVVDGTVYFGSQDTKVYAVDAATGQKKWEFQTGSWVESSPAVVDGVVYIGSNDGHLYALNAATGEKLWDFFTVYVIKSSPAVADGIVFFGADDHAVYALDARTGAQIWKYTTDNNMISSPVVADGIVYIGSQGKFCYGINAQNGRFRLRLPAWEVTSSPAVKDGVVYFTSRAYLFAMEGIARSWPGEMELRPWWIQLYAFNLAPPPPPRSGFLWATRIADISSNTTPVVVDNTLYTTGDNNVYRIDTNTHQSQWKFTAGDKINSSPCLANNVLYIGCDDGKLYTINAVTGQKLWDFQTGARISSSPTYANGVIYVTSEDGTLYAIE